VDAAMRAGKLFNKKTNSFIWQTAIKVMIVETLGYDELPQHLSNYIGHKAARTVQQKLNPDRAAISISREDEAEARRQVDHAEAGLVKANMLTDNALGSQIYMRS